MLPWFVLAQASTLPSPGSVEDLAIHARLAAHAGDGGTHGCLTTTVMELRQHWDHLPAADRAHLTELIAPFKDDLFAPIPVRHEAPPPPATDTCWGQQGDNRLVTEHFSIEWDGGITESTAERFGEALELGYQVEVEELGWNEPLNHPQYLMWVYVQNKNTNGAYTYVESCGGDYLPYIVAGKDSWGDPEWGDTMAVHEFNHALQFSTSYAPEFWYWEATATWIEEYPYPDVNGWADYIPGYTYYPYVAMSASSQSDQETFYHMYGMAIFNFYIDEYLGGPDAVRDAWKGARGGQESFNGADVVKSAGGDWDEVYVDFALRNAAMDYEEGNRMGSVSTEERVRELPFTGSPSKSHRPGGYGQNYWQFAQGPLGGTLEIDFSGDDVNWLVALVEVDESELVATAIGEIDDGQGSVSLDTSGDNPVYLVVSPLKHTTDTYEYEFTATLQGGDDPGDDEDSAEPTADSGDAGGDEGGDGGGVDATVDGDGTITIDASGCACGSAGAGGAGGLALGAAAATLAFSRRRVR